MFTQSDFQKCLSCTENDKIRGEHKHDGSVRTSVLMSRFGMILAQQEEKPNIIYIGLGDMTNISYHDISHLISR